MPGGGRGVAAHGCTGRCVSAAVHGRTGPTCCSTATWSARAETCARLCVGRVGEGGRGARGRQPRGCAWHTAAVHQVGCVRAGHGHGPGLFHCGHAWRRHVWSHTQLQLQLQLRGCHLPGGCAEAQAGESSEQTAAPAAARTTRGHWARPAAQPPDPHCPPNRQPPTSSKWCVVKIMAGRAATSGACLTACSAPQIARRLSASTPAVGSSSSSTPGWPAGPGRCRMGAAVAWKLGKEDRECEPCRGGG